MNKMIIQDKRNRILRDLRISVTDRCNFRCIYCMPREIYKKYNYLQHSELLTFEEIYRLVTIFSQLGVRKVRLTGGEPLVRKDLEQLIGFLNQIPDLDLSMTTNGSFPLERVHSLKNAGLKRITISLDSLDDGVFKKMNDVDQSVENTLLWISECEKIGLAPVKINTVIKRGVNEHSILPLVERFKKYTTHTALYRIYGCWHYKSLEYGRCCSCGGNPAHYRIEICTEPNRTKLSRRSRPALQIQKWPG